MPQDIKDFKLKDAPKAKQIPHFHIHYGDRREDNYYWLRDINNPEVLDYLNNENDYTNSYINKFSKLKSTIFSEITGRIKQEDVSVPFLKNGYYYFNRFEANNEYPIYYRKKGSLAADEELLINVNIEAEQYDYYDLNEMVISPDNQLMCYSEDVLSRRIFQIKVKHLGTNEFFDEVIRNTEGRAVWFDDSKTFLYISKDQETLRPDRILKHRVGTNPIEDEVVYVEADEACYIDISRSRSGKYIYIHSTSTLTSEVRYVEADSPDKAIRIFSPKQRGHLYFVSDNGNQFFIRSNMDALNFKIMTASLDNTNLEHWVELIPHRNDVLIESVSCFARFITLEERIDGVVRLRYLKDGQSQEIKFDEDSYVASFFNNYEFDPAELRFLYTSLTIPSSVYDCNLQSGKMILRKQQEVVGGYNPDDYQSERLYFKSRDNVSIPVSLVYKKALYKQEMPLLLYAYGSYGICIDPLFAATRLSLLDRGFIFVIAHIRGGEDLGRNWYEDGKLLKKKNTFYDFIDCANGLIASHYTTKDKLYAFGGSAGGLLMGAVINLAPELFKGIVAAVPFVDVVTTMLDPTIPLTTGEYDEWGDPNDPVYYEYMKSYSPIDNLIKGDYPALLVTTGLHDSQVQYWEPAKWVAKIRTLNTGNEPILLFTNMTAGHGGNSGRFERYKEVALIYTFICSLEGFS